MQEKYCESKPKNYAFLKTTQARSCKFELFTIFWCLHIVHLLILIGDLSGGVRAQKVPAPTLKIHNLMRFFFQIIFRKNADIVVAPLYVSEYRSQVVDFMMPYMYFTEDVLIKKDTSTEKVNYLEFLDPFDSQVWFCTLAALVAITVAVFVINYFSPYGYKDENGKRTGEEFSFFNCVWFALACMLQQGAENTPRNLSGTGRFMFFNETLLNICTMLLSGHISSRRPRWSPRRDGSLREERRRKFCTMVKLLSKRPSQDRQEYGCGLFWCNKPLMMLS